MVDAPMADDRSEFSSPTIDPRLMDHAGTRIEEGVVLRRMTED